MLVSERPHSGTLFSCSEHRRKVAFRRLRIIVKLHEACALITTALVRSRYHPARESCSAGSRAGGLQSARGRWTAPTSADDFANLSLSSQPIFLKYSVDSTATTRTLVRLTATLTNTGTYP